MTRLFALALLLLPAAGCAATLSPVTRIVLITLDTTRADRLGSYGYEQAETAHLDRLAEESVLFERAVSPVPTTLPAHSTIFTGLYPQDHGVRYNLVYRLRPEAVTLAEQLGEAGFATAAFPGSFVLAREYGVAQGFDTWAEPERVPPDGGEGQPLLSRDAREVVDLALDWLDGQAGEKIFLWAHFYDPHAPYLPPFPYSSRFRDRLYDGELAYTDAEVGRLLDRLRGDPQWGETLVVVAGDHGEGLYDHDELWHSHLVYETTQHVPLFIRAPGARPTRVDEPVSIVNIMPTVLDAAGLTPPAGLRGSSLRPVLEGARQPREAIYFESLAGSLNYGWAELKGIRFGRFKLIDSTEPELFDLDQDPGEQDNLAAFEAQTVADLRAQMEELAEPVADASLVAEATDVQMDAAAERLLAGLGYVAGGFGSSAADAPQPRRLIDLESDLNRLQFAVASAAWPEVEATSRYLLERDPTNKLALRNLTDALSVREEYAEAEAVAARIVEVYPDQAVGYTMLATVLHAQGKRQAAFDTLAVGREASPDSERLAYLSLVSGWELEHPVCRDELPGMVEAFPRSILMRIFQARCAAAEGRTNDAYQSLLRAMAGGFNRFDELLAEPEFAELAADTERSEILRGLKGKVTLLPGRPVSEEESAENPD